MPARSSNLITFIVTDTPIMPRAECPRADGKTGWKGLRLRPDLVGTEDGLAKAPYIRESRRIKAEFTVVEQHVGTEARRRHAHQENIVAETFPDSVGVGSYRIDLHPSTGGVNYIDISSLPFQIPLGALIPRRIENLLPACKNLARRTSPMAVSGSIPWNGPSARRPERSSRSARNPGSGHPPCGTRRENLRPFSHD